MTTRLIASLTLVGLLVSCQAPKVVAPGPTAYVTSSPEPTTAQRPATGPVGAIAGTWAKIPDMPTPRSDAATVAFEDRIIVIGGVGGPTVVERYDPLTKFWDRLPDLPVGVTSAMATAVDSGVDAGIFVFGGYVDGRTSRRSFYLPRAADAWLEIIGLPDPRAAGAAVAIDRSIFLVGGTASANTLTLSPWELDLEAGGWSNGAPMPTGRDHLAAVVIGGKICAIGGRDLSPARNLNAFECFDPDANKWETLPPLPTARGGIGAAVSKDRVVVIGGEQPSGTFKEVEVYDVKAGKWSRGPDLPTPRHSLGVASVKGIVYTIGGAPAPGASQTKACESLTLP